MDEKIYQITEQIVRLHQKVYEVYLPLVEDVRSRSVSEDDLSHLLDYLLYFACDEKTLGLPEAEMFLGKTDFKLNSMKNEGYVYQCVLAVCAENSIYEINKMLEENGITPLGNDPSLQ